MDTIKDPSLKKLLETAAERRASDLHLTEGEPPIFRVDGKLEFTNAKRLTREETKRLAYGLMSQEQIRQFEQTQAANFSLSLDSVLRIRANVHQQRGSVECALRLVPSRIRTIDDLFLPQAAKKLALLRNGLVLVTGPVGVGKTTTLAAMVDFINGEEEKLIVMIEDPIEYTHRNKHSVIKQLELASDTPSFAEALRNALRQDPNVIVVGEMRDRETISTALTAAETGHLVLATLHTGSAAGSINRMIDIFPPHQQEQVRIQIADSLAGILTQQLLPRADAPGRVLVAEVLVGTTAVRRLIREKQTHQIPGVMETGAQFGMQTMDRALAEAARRGLITRETAFENAQYPDVVRSLLGCANGRKAA